VTLWQVDIYPAPGQPDTLGRGLITEAADVGLGQIDVQAVRGFLVQGELSEAQILRLAHELLADIRNWSMFCRNQG
jgi:phosphoribosylformylglycinamidine synthase